MAPTAELGLWVVEGLLLFFLVHSVRDRRRLENLSREIEESAASSSRSDPERLRLEEQWRQVAGELGREGKSAAEIERLRRQVFSSS